MQSCGVQSQSGGTISSLPPGVLVQFIVVYRHNTQGLDLWDYMLHLLHNGVFCVGGVQEGWRGLGGWEEGGEGGGC